MWRAVRTARKQVGKAETQALSPTPPLGGDTQVGAQNPELLSEEQRI